MGARVAEGASSRYDEARLVRAGQQPYSRCATMLALLRCQRNSETRLSWRKNTATCHALQE